MTTKKKPLSVPERAAYRRLEDVVGCKWSAAVLAVIGRGVTRPGQRHWMFNVVPTRAEGREPYRLFTEEGTPPAFTDAWLTAPVRRGPATTKNNLHSAPSLQPDKRKDWVLVRGPVRLHQATVHDYHRDGIYPSNHLPVIIEFSWGRLRHPLRPNPQPNEFKSEPLSKQ